MVVGVQNHDVIKPGRENDGGIGLEHRSCNVGRGRHTGARYGRSGIEQPAPTL